MRGGLTKKQIAACIKQMSGKYAPQLVFADWIQCVALSISNSVQIFHDNLWKQREEQYLATMNRYGKEERMKMAEMAGMLILAYEKGLGDVLGEVYMESIGGNKNSGQFFTPYSVSLATARLTLPDTIDENKKLSFCEPTCGSGGMVIAAAQVLQEKGINYQRVLDVVCQDLDWTAVYMCYVQLSLLGVKAIVAQGNTLTEPYTANHPKEKVFYTPAKRGLLI